MQIAREIVISLGRGAPSRALWFGKVQQTSRVEGSPGNTPFSATPRFLPLSAQHIHFLPPFSGQGGWSQPLGPWSYDPSAPDAVLLGH